MGNSPLRSGISKNVFEPKLILMLEKKVINSILGADTVVKHSSESFSTNGREINSRTRDVIVQIHIGYRNYSQERSVNHEKVLPRQSNGEAGLPKGLRKNF